MRVPFSTLYLSNIMIRSIPYQFTTVRINRAKIAMKLKSSKKRDCIQYILLSVSSVRITTSFLILTALFKSCQAQAEGPDVAFIIAPLVFGGMGFVFLFGTCVCIVLCCCLRHPRPKRSNFNSRAVPFTHSVQQQQGEVAGVWTQGYHPSQSSTPYPTSPAGSTSHTVQ